MGLDWEQIVRRFGPDLAGIEELDRHPPAQLAWQQGYVPLLRSYNYEFTSCMPFGGYTYVQPVSGHRVLLVESRSGILVGWQHSSGADGTDLDSLSAHLRCLHMR